MVAFSTPVDPAGYAMTSLMIEQGEMYAGYACEPSLREVASSGGVVSSILLHLLERGIIDGALVSRITSRDGKVAAVTELAHTREGILACAGSSYVDTPVLKAVQALDEFSGRVAVVLLPCQARALAQLLEKKPALREKVYLSIALFCRGTVDRRFYEDWFRREGIDEAAVASLKIRRSHYTGQVVLHMHDGSERAFPFQRMNGYRLAGVHAKNKCCWCEEHLGAAADISVGDLFMPEYKARPVKHSAFIGRTPRGVETLQGLCDAAALTAEFVGMATYRKTFARIERFSNTLAPRYAAARLAGLKPARAQHEHGNLFHTLAWTIYFKNCCLSRTERGRRLLYALPSAVISLMALLIKLLSKW